MAGTTSAGDRLLLVLGALANPHRLRIVAALAQESTYVSQLARDLGLSRPLLHMHLQRLQAAGLITDRMEVSAEGKAMRWVEVTDFDLALSAASIAAAAPSLTDPPSTDGRTKGKN